MWMIPWHCALTTDLSPEKTWWHNLATPGPGPCSQDPQNRETSVGYITDRLPSLQLILYLTTSLAMIGGLFSSDTATLSIFPLLFIRCGEYYRDGPLCPEFCYYLIDFHFSINMDVSRKIFRYVKALFEHGQDRISSRKLIYLAMRGQGPPQCLICNPSGS